MVSSQEEEVLGVFDLVRQQETDRLQRLFPAVYVVSEKEVVALRGEASVLKQTQQVVILAVDVSCNKGACKHLKVKFKTFFGETSFKKISRNSEK